MLRHSRKPAPYAQWFLAPRFSVGSPKPVIRTESCRDGVAAPRSLTILREEWKNTNQERLRKCQTPTATPAKPAIHKRQNAASIHENLADAAQRQVPAPSFSFRRSWRRQRISLERRPRGERIRYRYITDGLGMRWAHVWESTEQFRSIDPHRADLF